MNWFMENWVNILACFGGLVAAASAFVKMTPTQKDDNILAKVVKWADVFSIVFTKKDAQVIADALKKKTK